MDLPGLPFDVLATIASHLDREQLAAAAATSHAHYNAIMPVALESISIHGNYSAMSGNYMSPALGLCDLFKRRPDFLPCVKWLGFRPDYEAGEAGERAWDAVADLVEKMPNIHTLQIRDSGLTTTPNLRILRVLSRREGLRIIGLDMGKYSFDEACSFLRGIIAPIVELRLRKSYGSQHIKEDSLISSLSRFQSSLEVLDLFEFNLSGLTSSPNASMTFTQLKELQISRCEIPAATLPRAFPNLKALSISALKVTCDDSAAAGLNQGADSPWSNLTSLWTDLSSFQSLSSELSGCRVIHLAVTETISTSDAVALLERLLQATRPIILEVSIEVLAESPSGILCFEEHVEEVQSLFLAVRSSRIRSSGDVDSMINCLDRDLASFITNFTPVQYVNLAIQTNKSSRGPQPFSFYPDYYEARDLVTGLAPKMSRVSLLSISWRQAGWKSLRYRVVNEIADGMYRSQRWIHDGSGGWSPATVRWLYQNDRETLSQILRPEEDHMSVEEYDELYGDF